MSSGPLFMPYPDLGTACTTGALLALAVPVAAAPEAPTTTGARRTDCWERAGGCMRSTLRASDNLLLSDVTERDMTTGRLCAGSGEGNLHGPPRYPRP
ncbi:hypothetical protein GCM10011578_098190 [Streptomyces fuscichromogenes]|uniref:Uncharacterized protein n=1 Tax=Streptomyces fuscichromogenes TaxID=1324013 RepID=A0A917XQL0_9ACTN|nr:hypothetical protein GCM10011578_098190 [Streptomyces fuscichromogenes]